MYQFIVLIVLIALTNSLSIKSTPTTRSDNIRLILPKDRNSSETRIFGGTEASPNDFSYQVGMYIVKGNLLSFCGGSLIAQDVALTAAQCVNNADEVYVFFGHHNTPDYVNILNGKEENVLKSTEFCVHEDFDETIFINDVALVYLPEKVTLTQHIKIVPLDNGTDKHAGEEATVSGWGITYNGGTFQIGSGLRYAQDEIISNEECKSSATQLNSIIKDSHICLSNENNKGVCYGDSGGPLVIDDVQVGIVSFGSSICTPKIPSGFTRVSSFAHWIAEHVPGATLTSTTEASSNGSTGTETTTNGTTESTTEASSSGIAVIIYANPTYVYISLILIIGTIKN